MHFEYVFWVLSQWLTQEVQWKQKAQMRGNLLGAIDTSLKHYVPMPRCLPLPLGGRLEMFRSWRSNYLVWLWYQSTVLCVITVSVTPLRELSP